MNFKKTILFFGFLILVPNFAFGILQEGMSACYMLNANGMQDNLIYDYSLFGNNANLSDNHILIPNSEIFNGFINNGTILLYINGSQNEHILLLDLGIDCVYGKVLLTYEPNNGIGIEVCQGKYLDSIIVYGITNISNTTYQLVGGHWNSEEQSTSINTQTIGKIFPINRGNMVSMADITIGEGITDRISQIGMWNRKLSKEEYDEYYQDGDILTCEEIFGYKNWSLDNISQMPQISDYKPYKGSGLGIYSLLEETGKGLAIFLDLIKKPFGIFLLVIGILGQVVIFIALFRKLLEKL